MSPCNVVVYSIFRSKIELGDVTPHNIKQLKLLNQVVFPVSYNEKFYKDVLEAGELAKLAYYNDIVVDRFANDFCLALRFLNFAPRILRNMTLSV